MKTIQSKFSLRLTNIILLVTGFLLAASSSYGHCPSFSDDTAVGRDTSAIAVYAVYEIALSAQNAGPNPYRDGPEVVVTFTGTSDNALGKSLALKGFWDGGSTYRVRFTPNATGDWAWTSSSSDMGLNGKSGNLSCRGTLPAGHASMHGHVHESKTYPYTFAHDDATPFFLMGDTQWLFSSSEVSWPTEFQAYVDARAAQGFNFVHGQIYALNPPGAESNEGGPAFNFGNVDNLNPGYWQQLDKRVAYLNAKGIVAGLVLAWANEGWQQFSTTTQVERYIQYLVNRYAAYNVIWITAGEYEESEPPGGHHHIGEYLSANDPYHHPITTHTIDTSADDFGHAAWHTTIYQQTRNPALITHDRKYDKPVINSEFGYEGYQSPEEVRQDAWEIIMRGGFFVYGNTATYHRNASMTPENLYSAGAAYMTILKNFWTNNGKYAISWWKFSRFDSLGNSRWLAGQPGVEYVVYVDNPDSFTIDLSDAHGDIFGHWFNTRTGQWDSTFSGAASAAFALTPPGAGFVAYIIVPTMDRLVAVSGDAQIGNPGELLPKPLVVKVLNSIGAGAPNTEVEFHVISGGGRIVQPGSCDSARCIVVTGADGVAEVNWRLGMADSQRVEARILNRPDLVAFFAASLNFPSTITARTAPLPATLALRLYPNPFRSRTRFEVALPAPGWISLKIFDLQGREVVALAEGEKSSGRLFVDWNGTGRGSNVIASGIYFVILRYQTAMPNTSGTNSQIFTHKLRVLYLK
ncbi:MAG: DUF4038 domain-containing protein [candidate division KSB1 bacterium]|nr:DUF4038 domain-containing protein [candidate division KSB1 bacterium]MDZ7302024.1 DUF4038 domain-containing protein [candidate division KSB1 bacterium]MDZ7310206.1 DUF4038 domain-containing protein [candidate division KSB1 bacterium]